MNSKWLVRVFAVISAAIGVWLVASGFNSDLRLSVAGVLVIFTSSLSLVWQKIAELEKRIGEK